MKTLYYILVGIWLFSPLSLFAEEEIGKAIENQLQILKKDSNNMAALKEVGMLYLNKADYDNAIYYGSRLQEKAYNMPQNPYYCIYSHIILGQCYVMKGQRERAYNNLGQAEASAQQIHNDSALCSVYNGLGLYSAFLDKDYYQALSHYFKGLETAEKCRYEKLYSILLGNISTIYYLKKDTAGLRYALECYERGHNTNNTYLIRIGAECSALMYYLKHDYRTALNYIKEDEFVTLQNNFFDQADVYNLYGMILSALHKEYQALDCFEKALGYEASSQSNSILHTYIEYARTLMQMGRHNEANACLQKGEEYIMKQNALLYKGELYEMLSLFYEQTGQFDKALEYRKIYQTENDSLFNVSKEHILNDLRIKYYTKVLENNVNEARLKQVNKERQVEIMSVIIIAIILIACTLFYLYHRKNRLYRAIVQQNQLSIAREKKLFEQIEELKTSNASSTISFASNSTKYNTSLSNEKVTDLYNRLETLMRERRVYTDNMLTKEKVSEMLETNRTYLSQIINDQTGKSFTQYVNEFRIHEAIQRLSDPKETIPLKALSAELGFNSMTTFYNLFQTMVGMTPTQYRNSVQELDKG